MISNNLYHVLPDKLQFKKENSLKHMDENTSVNQSLSSNQKNKSVTPSQEDGNLQKRGLPKRQIPALVVQLREGNAGHRNRASSKTRIVFKLCNIKWFPNEQPGARGCTTGNDVPSLDLDCVLRK